MFNIGDLVLVRSHCNLMLSTFEEEKDKNIFYGDPKSLGRNPFWLEETIGTILEVLPKSKRFEKKPLTTIYRVLLGERLIDRFYLSCYIKKL